MLSLILYIEYIFVEISWIHFYRYKQKLVPVKVEWVGFQDGDVFSARMYCVSVEFIWDIFSAEDPKQSHIHSNFWGVYLVLYTNISKLFVTICE